MILMRGHATLDVQAAVIADAVAAGAIGDVLLWRLRPSLARGAALRAFAFALPVAYWALYLGTVALVFGSWWRVHSLVGVPLLAGAVGLLASLVLYAPAPRRAN